MHVALKSIVYLALEAIKTVSNIIGNLVDPIVYYNFNQNANLYDKYNTHHCKRVSYHLVAGEIEEYILNTIQLKSIRSKSIKFFNLLYSIRTISIIARE